MPMTRIGLRITWALAAAALLGGCASTADEWTKPGADEAAVSQAYRTCRSMADERVGPEIGINQDILSTRGADWQRAQVQTLQTRTMTESTRDRAAAIVASCMNANGFQRTP
jgi:hypothetical protein